MNQSTWVLATSNEGKLREFRSHFDKYGITLDSTHVDIKEIDADPISVVVHKASQVDEGVLVEDTSLDVEGADVGVNVKWMLEHLPSFLGSKVCWRVLLAYRKESFVYVFEGKTDGIIVPPSGTGGFGFDPIFLPDGCNLTLAHEKPEAVDARLHVVKAFVQNCPTTVCSPITDWTGRWQ
jgi:XTP/dITP diphosphohydrolase